MFHHEIKGSLLIHDISIFHLTGPSHSSIIAVHKPNRGNRGNPAASGSCKRLRQQPGRQQQQQQPGERVVRLHPPPQGMEEPNVPTRRPRNTQVREIEPPPPRPEIHQKLPPAEIEFDETLPCKPIKTRYKFPVKRFRLARDHKDTSLESNGIGLKIVGGKEVPESGGRLAAYVAKVFPRKQGDTMPHIREGDIVLEWNGISLDNKTFEEVASVIQEYVTDEVELVIRSNYNILDGSSRGHTEESTFSQRIQERETKPPSDLKIPAEGEDTEKLDFSRYYGIPESSGREIISRGRLALSPSSESTEATSASTSIHQSGTIFEPHHLAIPTETDLRKQSTSSLPPSWGDHASRDQRKGSANISVKSMGFSSPPEADRSNKPHKRPKKGSYGQIELMLCHDAKAEILYVTVLKARLPRQKNEDGTDHVQVDPYVTVFLLPDRVLENQRRTRHVPMSSSPIWNQTMVYPNVSVADLKEKYLEVAVRNYNPSGEDPMLGKIILYLSDEGILEERPHSYSLRLEDKTYSRKRSSQGHFHPGEEKQVRSRSRSTCAVEVDVES